MTSPTPPGSRRRVSQLRRAWRSGVLGALAAAAACGGAATPRLTHDEYARRVNAALARLDARIRTLSTKPESLTALRDSLRATADDLDRLEPPRDADDANDDLVDGLRSFASEVEAETDVLRDAPTAVAREALVRIARSPGVHDIQRAEAELRRAGYVLP